MKYSVLLLIALAPLLSIGQTAAQTDSLAKGKLNDLIESWTLGIDSTADEVDIKVYNKFKSLFDLAATVDDGLNAVYQYRNGKAGGYKIEARPKAFDDYAHDAALQLRYMRLDTVVKLAVNTANPKNMLFTLFLRMSFQKPRKYVLPESYVAQVIGSRKVGFESKADSVAAVAVLNTRIGRSGDSVYKFMVEDTVQIAMAFLDDTVRVTGIKSTVGKVACVNDADLDAVLDGEDSLKNVFGDFTAAGGPTTTLTACPITRTNAPLSTEPPTRAAPLLISLQKKCSMPSSAYSTTGKK